MARIRSTATIETPTSGHPATPAGSATSGPPIAVTRRHSSEEPFRLLSERSQDVFYRVGLPSQNLEYISGAVSALTGHSPTDFYAEPDLWKRLVHPADRDAKLQELDVADIHEPMVLRWLTKDGSSIWTEHRSVPVHGPDGDIVAIEGVARDVTRRVLAEQGLRASEARYREFLASIELGALMLDIEGRVEFINDHLLALLGQRRETMLGRDWVEVVPAGERAEERRWLAESLTGGRLTGTRESGVITLSGEQRRLAWTSVLQRQADGQVVGIASIAHDVTELHRIEAQRSLLAAAVAQTADAVIITDPQANILFVNPAFERVSGYARGEVIGKNPRLLQSGTQERAVFDDMWSTLRSGAAWEGELANRRKDGVEYTDSLTVTPVSDADGTLSAYISVQRDISHVREVEAELILDARVRGLLGEAIVAAAATSTLEGAAQAVCDGLASLPGIDVAHLIAFLEPHVAVVIASQAPDGSPLHVGQRLPAARARYLLGRAAGGPWGERVVPTAGTDEMGDGMLEAGVQALAFGPIGRGPAVGVLVVGTCDSRYDTVVATKMPALVAFGVSANTVLIERLMESRKSHRLSAALDTVLGTRAFHPVFQPIVELRSGETIGYEALTRFDSEQRPDECFADAWTIGMGAELELATIEAAVAAAHELPAGRWLHVNVSPRLLHHVDAVASKLRASDRPIVIEITEHELIEDYAAVRAASAALGSDVRMAVDDAGVGIANFGHIIELRPDFVKIDISLIRRVNADPGRQALVAAMGHFARTAGCRLVAEGVETEAEARTLKLLAVEFGQGYWFGRPEPAARWSADAS